MSDDWRSWPVWEVMPPAEMLPQLYGGDPLKGGELRDDWRLPQSLQGWALNDRDYGLPGFDDYSTLVAYEDTSREPKRVLRVETQSLDLPDAFNDYLERWDDVHHVERMTCGTTKTSKDPYCVVYAEDTVIALGPALGRFTEQEVVDAMDELVDHLLATR
ncbi:hypothetical protein EII42_09940 [Tessaracoccus sp. OH4464_COT-324]|nr:hypothetical protein EII42_09940 [Tessaracoccus sp. OH4464_COT-324]